MEIPISGKTRKLDHDTAQPEVGNTTVLLLDLHIFVLFLEGVISFQMKSKQESRCTIYYRNEILFKNFPSI